MSHAARIASRDDEALNVFEFAGMPGSLLTPISLRSFPLCRAERHIYLSNGGIRPVGA
jgi:hypothetical protein